MSRARVLFLAWAPTAGRARDLARALDGEASTVYPSRLSARRLTPARYAASMVLTAAELARRRPRAVVVQNPPVYPSLLAIAYVRATGGRFVLDSHPASFGVKGNRQAQRTLAVTRWLARHADATLVTTSSWADVVSEWGGRPLVLHEAPPHWTVSPPRPLEDRRPQVLFSCVFAQDEPVDDVVEAARRAPELDVAITGDPRRAREGQLDSLPPNVRLTGWLDQEAYAAEVDRCDILLALTDEPTSVMRAAYEAGYARRVLVLSGTPVMTALFPEAVPTGNDAESLTVSLRDAVARHDELIGTLDTIRERQRRRWSEQEDAIRGVLGLEPSQPDGDGSADPATAAATARSTAPSEVPSP
jgi:glycosyltransferase involved in cell wall biosynthesis